MIRKLFGSALALVGLLGLTQIAAAQGPLTGWCCPDACPEKCCRSVTETKTVTVRKYDDVCEDFCRPKCSIFSLFTGSCDCAEGNCGTMHTKKYLVVKICKHDECVHKCVVDVAAPCAAPCYGAAPMMAPPARMAAPVTVGSPMPTGQPMPMPLPGAPR